MAVRCFNCGLPNALTENGKIRKTLKEVCRDHVKNVLEFYDGDKEKTAEVLGISRATMYRYLKKMAL